MKDCSQCAYQGDDGLCFCEDPADCPRGILEEEGDDLEIDLEEAEIEGLEEEEEEDEE